MSTRWDLSGYDKQNNLVLIVETKTRLGTSQEWAAQLRRNILSHGILPNAPYFLMAFPDTFYLWVDSKIIEDIVLPTYVIDAQPLLQHYFHETGTQPDQITGSSFELIIAAWLNTIIQGDNESQYSDQSNQWIHDSKLAAALSGGTLDYEVMV